MPTFFTNIFSLKIDDKKRLVIPSEVRKKIDKEQLGTKIYLNIGPGRRIWMYPEKTYEAWLAQIPMEMNPGKERRVDIYKKFSLAVDVELDEQGRMLLPDSLLRRAKAMERDVMLVGAGDHLELWDRATWDAALPVVCQDDNQEEDEF